MQEGRGRSRSASGPIGDGRPAPRPATDRPHRHMDETDPNHSPCSVPDLRPAARGAAVLGLALAVAACGDRGPGDPADSPCPYPAGGPRPVHEAADPGRWLSDVPTWHVRETSVLGAASPDGDGVVLEGVDDVEAGAGGRVHVADGASGRVWTFAADGDTVRRLGGEEASPGPPNSFLETGVGPGDTLRAFHLRSLRETVFDTAGRLLDTASVSEAGGFGPSPEIAYDRRGTLYRLGWRSFGPSLGEALEGRSEGVARGEVTLERWSKEDGAWSPIAPVPGVEVHVSREELRDAPFAARPLWDAVDEGLWWADSRAYLLTRLSADGDTVCRVRVDVDPPEVSEEDRRAFLEAEDVDEYAFNRRQRVRRARAGMPLPDRRPALRDLVGAGDGGVWVRPAPETWSARPDTVTWHAFDADGELVARVRLPRDVRPERVGRDFVLGVRRVPAGLDHVDRVVRLEVVREE